MNVEMMNKIADEVLESCTLSDGKLVLTDDTFLKFGKRIDESNDKRSWATALVALVNRLRTVPGAGPAAERITALAAVALGDRELKTLLQRNLPKS